jgi:hypothetical protein
MRYLDYPLMMVQMPMDFYMHKLSDLMDQTARKRGLISRLKFALGTISIPTRS